MRLAKRLKSEFGADVSLVRGGGGVFDVNVDGALIYSKHDRGRFPEPDEVVSLIAAR